MALLELRDLRTYFHTKRGTIKAVNGVSYSVDAGKVLGVVGESGSGKSVSAMSILRLLDNNGYIDGGEIFFDGQELTKLPEDINYVFVRDGGHMSFEFFCAGFKKKIYGSSLLTIGHQELEEDPNSQKYCAVLYRAYEEIKKLIDSEHPNIL